MLILKNFKKLEKAGAFLQIHTYSNLNHPHLWVQQKQSKLNMLSIFISVECVLFKEFEKLI